MASGSAGRANNSGSKGFNFASDDILCSYEDFGNQDGSNGNSHSDPVIGANPATVYSYFVLLFKFVFDFRVAFGYNFGGCGVCIDLNIRSFLGFFGLGFWDFQVLVDH